MKILILFLLSFSLCAGEIQPISKGQEAEFSGFLITKDFEKRLRTINEENKLLERKNVTLERLGNVNEDIAQHYKKRASKAELRGDLKGIGGFLLGVLVTGAIAVGLSKNMR